MTHICVNKLTSIGSDNGLSPGRRQAIIWTNAGILLIWTLGTNFSEILSQIRAYSFKKMHFKMASAKWRPFCHGLNELTQRHRNKNKETSVKRRETLNRLRSIFPNMIKHFDYQSPLLFLIMYLVCTWRNKDFVFIFFPMSTVKVRCLLLAVCWYSWFGHIISTVAY